MPAPVGKHPMSRGAHVPQRLGSRVWKATLAGEWLCGASRRRPRCTGPHAHHIELMRRNGQRFERVPPRDRVALDGGDCTADGLAICPEFGLEMQG